MDNLIRHVRELERRVKEDLPEAVATALEKEVKKSAAQGKSPEGGTWDKTETGARALPKAANQIKVRVNGDTIELSVDGIYARHDKGWVRGGKQRRIIPLSILPLVKVVQDAIKKAVQP